MHTLYGIIKSVTLSVGADAIHPPTPATRRERAIVWRGVRTHTQCLIWNSNLEIYQNQRDLSHFRLKTRKDEVARRPFKESEDQAEDEVDDDKADKKSVKVTEYLEDLELSRIQTFGVVDPGGESKDPTHDKSDTRGESVADKGQSSNAGRSVSKKYDERGMDMKHEAVSKKYDERGCQRSGGLWANTDGSHSVGIKCAYSMVGRMFGLGDSGLDHSLGRLAIGPETGSEPKKTGRELGGASSSSHHHRATRRHRVLDWGSGCGEPLAYWHRHFNVSGFGVDFARSAHLYANETFGDHAAAGHGALRHDDHDPTNSVSNHDSTNSVSNSGSEPEVSIFAETGFPSIRFSYQDGLNLTNFPDEFFDVISSFGVIYHLPPDTQCALVKNILLKKLKPGGRIWFGFHFRHADFDPGIKSGDVSAWTSTCSFWRNCLKETHDVIHVSAVKEDALGPNLVVQVECYRENLLFPVTAKQAYPTESIFFLKNI